MATIAVDWDDTLVDVHGQQWQEGAEHFLRTMLAQGHKLIIHSCRANWPEGRQQIADKIRHHHLDHPALTIEGKPAADVYVDNQAVRYEGDWQTILERMPAPARPVAAATRAPKPATATARPTFATRP